MELLLIALSGMSIGSVMNVIIYRLPIMIENKSFENSNSINLWRPRSFCPHCKTTISFCNNIPLFSFLILKGKSVCCRRKISPRYFSIELTTCLVMILLFFSFGFTKQFFGAALLICSLIVLKCIDIDTYLLPDQVTLPLLWLGLMFNYFNTFADLQSALLGAILGYVFFFGVAQIFYYLRKKEGLGQGDFKLLAMLGAWLGWQNLPMIVFIASFVGFSFSAISILYKRHHHESAIPFGPYLALGGIIMLIWSTKFFH